MSNVHNILSPLNDSLCAKLAVIPGYIMYIIIPCLFLHLECKTSFWIKHCMVSYECMYKILYQNIFLVTFTCKIYYFIIYCCKAHIISVKLYLLLGTSLQIFSLSSNKNQNQSWKCNNVNTIVTTMVMNK